MKANELRIGNYIFADLYNDKYILVESICSKNEDIFNSECGEIPLTSLKPIPLTEEILLKCGYFKLEHLDTHFVIKGHTIWICNDMFLCEKNGVILKHLHQLQNLYFALTNNELKIEL